MRLCGSSRKQEFTGFCIEFGCKVPPQLKPIDENRYINFEVAALSVYQYFNLIFMFYVFSWPALPQSDHENFRKLCDNEIFFLIYLRAAGCNKILKPLMKYSSGFHLSKELAKLLQQQIDNCKSLKVTDFQNNCELLDGAPERKDIKYLNYVETIRTETIKYRQISNLPQTFLANNGFVLDKKQMKTLNNFKSIVDRIILSSNIDTNILLTDRSSNMIVQYNNRSLDISNNRFTLPSNAIDYINGYLQVCVDTMEKHNCKFIKEANEGDNIVIKGTNRHVERRFGLSKNVLKKNKYTRQLHLHQKTTLAHSKEYFDKFKEITQTEETLESSSNKFLESLISLILSMQNQKPKITNDVLKNLLINKYKAKPTGTTRAKLLLDIAPYIKNDFCQMFAEIVERSNANEELEELVTLPIAL